MPISLFILYWRTHDVPTPFFNQRLSPVVPMKFHLGPGWVQVGMRGSRSGCGSSMDLCAFRARASCLLAVLEWLGFFAWIGAQTVSIMQPLLTFFPLIPRDAADCSRFSSAHKGVRMTGCPALRYVLRHDVTSVPAADDDVKDHPDDRSSPVPLAHYRRRRSTLLTPILAPYCVRRLRNVPPTVPGREWFRKC